MLPKEYWTDDHSYCTQRLKQILPLGHLAYFTILILYLVVAADSVIIWFRHCPWNFQVHTDPLGNLVKMQIWLSGTGVRLGAAILGDACAAGQSTGCQSLKNIPDEIQITPTTSIPKNIYWPQITTAGAFQLSLLMFIKRPVKFIMMKSWNFNRRIIMDVRWQKFSHFFFFLPLTLGLLVEIVPNKEPRGQQIYASIYASL